MIVIDTNLLVRVITGDNPTLAKQAINMIENYDAGDIFIPQAVLVELFFVLEFHEAYKMNRLQITGAFREIIVTPQIRIAKQDLKAFELYAGKPKLDFADCVLLVLSDKRRKQILTFDKELQKNLKAF